MAFKSDWLIFSFIVIILWGMWGFFSKIASNYTASSNIYLFGTIGALLVWLFAIFFLGFKFEIKPIGVLFSILAGALGGSGIIFFYYAMKGGKASVVVAITALYPLVTLLLSYLILREQLTLKQIIGIFLAIIAVILMSL